MWHRDIKNKTICCAPMNIPHDTSCPGDVDPRDHGKARKFKKMSDAGAVPEHILDLINEQSKKSNQPRQAKTALINKLFEKNGKGGYDMVINKPVFQQHKESWSNRYGKDECQGSPKDVFLYQVFHGAAEALEAAIRNGSVMQYDQGGTTFCSFRRTVAGMSGGSAVKLKAASEQEVSKEQFKLLGKSFSSLALAFDDQERVAEEAAEAAGSSKSATSTKFLETSGLTPAMAEVLSEAKACHERLYSQAMKLLSKCTSDEDKKKFKKTIMAIKEWMTKDENVLTWKDYDVCHARNNCM